VGHFTGADTLHAYIIRMRYSIHQARIAARRRKSLAQHADRSRNAAEVVLAECSFILGIALTFALIVNALTGFGMG